MTATLFRNPARVRRLPVAPRHPPAAATLAFHRRLPGYARTPLVEAPELARAVGLERLWVKVESSRLGLPAFKMLGASWATYRAVLQRLGFEDPTGAPGWTTMDDLRELVQPLGPLTLAAATDGNHGRAVARTARLLGYDARIFVPAGTAPARIDAIASEGASVTVVKGTYDDAVRVSAAEASEKTLVISDTSWEGYTDVPQWVIDGYSTIFGEIDEQLGGLHPDVVAVQMGVGALAAATVRHFSDRAKVVVVEPLRAACGMASARAGMPVEVPGPHESIMAGLNCGNVSIVAWPTVAAGTDLFIAIDDAAAERAMRDLASIGVEAGETGGAGLAGFTELAVTDRDGDCLPLAGRRALVICTEGATDPAQYARIVGI